MEGNAILQTLPGGWLRGLPFKGGHCQGNVSEVAELRRQMEGFFHLPLATGNSNCDVLMMTVVMTIITAAWKVSHARLTAKMTLPLVYL